jgi:hypothetical protein
MEDETDKEKALRQELEAAKLHLERTNRFHAEEKEREKERHQYDLSKAKEDGKFYNSDGFWLLFWIVLPLVLLGLGFNIG